MKVERSVLAKLASNGFTDEERGYLVEMLLAKQSEDCPPGDAPMGGHKAPPFGKKDDEKETKKEEAEEKKSSYAGFDFDAIVKEASALSDGELKEAIEAAAVGIPDGECDAIVKQAYDEVVAEASMRKQAMEFGYYMFQGFDYGAQQKVAVQREKQAAEGFSRKAPALAAALRGR